LPDINLDFNQKLKQETLKRKTNTKATLKKKYVNYVHGTKEKVI